MSIYTENNSSSEEHLKTLSNYSCGPSLLWDNETGEHYNTSFCIQQSNTDFRKNLEKPGYLRSNNDMNEAVDKNILIEQATNRLRQKVLESKLKSFISSLVEIKSRLEIIKLETSISLQLLPTASDSIMTELQLEHFEKRFINHVQSLKTLIPPQKYDKIDNLVVEKQVPSTLSETPTDNSITTASTFSETNTSSSSANTSSMDYRDKKQQINILSHISSMLYGDNNNVLESDYSILGEYDHQKRISKRKKFYQHQNDLLNYNILSAQQSSSSSSLSQDILHSFIHRDTPHIDNASRNAFDDVLSYINDNTSDIEFRDDLSELLASPLFSHPQEKKQKQKKGLFKQILSTSIKWIRLTLVMFLAVLIYLKRRSYSYYPTLSL